MLQAMNDCCVVRQDEKKEFSDGGIYLPDRVQIQHADRSGVVISVGPGTMDDHGNVIPLSVSVGDKILFGQYGLHNEVEHNGEKLLLMREEHILAIVTE